ncbi:MAG: choice-of-anchor B family protein [Planctomycetota bacterium]|jgi:choice-of-anchor B domain-containing protein
MRHFDCSIHRVAAVAAMAIATPLLLGGFPASNVSLHSHLPLGDFGSSFAEDCWGYVSPSGREYAIIGVSEGTAFVEITDPGNPQIIDVIGTANHGRDMKVYGDHVYSSSDEGPLNVIDVSDIDNGTVSLVNSINQGTHNLAVNADSGFLYLSIGGPLMVMDLADPVNPAEAGVWPGEAHDAQVVTYAEGKYAGREIAFVSAGWSAQLDIVDVTDKGDMFLVSSLSYPNAAYAHQGWLSEDRVYFYLNDELDGIQRTLIVNVSDLDNPFLVDEFSSGAPSTDHNLYVHDGFIFEANYTGGLRIFDACDPESPVEVGFFDTFPANDAKGFDGAWSNYPYFPSGTVIVSDRSDGLFVLDPSAALEVLECGTCPADCANMDGVVSTADLLELLAQWGGPGSCDIDGSGTVSTADPLDLLGEWGPCP